MGVPSLSYASKLGISPTLTAAHTTQRFQFLSATLGLRERLIDANGITGDRSRDVERIRGGLQHVNGQIVMEPTAVEWASLLDWVMDGTHSGSGLVTYVLGLTAAQMFVEIDKIINVPLYDKVAVNKMTIQGNQGEALRVTFDLIGATQTLNAANSFPNLSFDRTSAPFVFMDAGVTGIVINGVDCTPKSWTFTLDNHLDVERFFTSITLTQPVALDRTTTLSMQIPFDSVQSALYGAGAGGVAASLTNTNGSQVLGIQFPALTFPRENIDQPGRVEEMY